MSILPDQSFDSAFDAPDERDFRFGSVITKKVNVPDEILPDYKTPVLNQGRTMRCTLFSVSQGINEQNYEEAKRIGVSQYKTLNGTEYIPDAIRDFDYSEEKGGFVQNALKLYRDKGEYEGYVRIE
jgi:hypothetical protein